MRFLPGFPHKRISECHFDARYPDMIAALLFAHSRGGGGELRGGLPQSKESDRRAIGALYLDPHSGEAVMLRPLDPPPPFTSTAPNRHSLSQSRSRPAPPVLQQSQVGGGAVTETDREAKTKTKKETRTQEPREGDG